MQYLVSSKNLGEGPVSSRHLIQGHTFNERLSQSLVSNTSLGQGHPSREGLIEGPTFKGRIGQGPVL